MEKIQDTQRINQILQKGDITFRDPDSGYRYSLCAVCPNDGNECSITSYERKGGELSSITRVTYYCPICNNRFDAKPEDMFLR